MVQKPGTLVVYTPGFIAWELLPFFEAEGRGGVKLINFEVESVIWETGTR
jgi:hypothetical protein